MHTMEHFQRWLEAESTKWKKDFLIDLSAPCKQNSSNKSNSSKSLEFLFTKKILAPAITKYFYSTEFLIQNKFNAVQIKAGLGAEGYQNMEGFGFSVSRKTNHILTKNEAILGTAPNWWFSGEETITKSKRPYPDFAIKLLPHFSCIGEVKYFVSESQNSAKQALYNTIREAIFYLGAFNGDYQNALIVMADSSKSQILAQTARQLNPEFKKRLGKQSGIYLTVVSL